MEGLQVVCMRQVLGPGALGRPRGSGWRGRWEGGSGWGTKKKKRMEGLGVWMQIGRFKPACWEKVVGFVGMAPSSE